MKQSIYSDLLLTVDKLPGYFKEPWLNIGFDFDGLILDVRLF